MSMFSVVSNVCLIDFEVDDIVSLYSEMDLFDSEWEMRRCRWESFYSNISVDSGFFYMFEFEMDFNVIEFEEEMFDDYGFEGELLSKYYENVYLVVLMYYWFIIIVFVMLDNCMFFLNNINFFKSVVEIMFFLGD